MRRPPRLHLVVPIGLLLFWIATRAVAWRVHYNLVVATKGDAIARAEAWEETLAAGVWTALLLLGLGVAIHFLVVRKVDSFIREATEASEETARQLVDIKAALDAHSIVAVTDAAGRITSVNDKFCEISKFPRVELLGQDHRIINSGFHPKSFFQDLWRTISSGQVWKGEIRNRAKDGTFYWVETTIVPIRNSRGKVAQYVAIRTDITQRKEDELQLQQYAEELSAKNKELETVVYVVSHDLRSPLLNVQGFGAMLMRVCGELKEKWRSGETQDVERLLDKDLPHALRFIEAGIAKMDALLSGFLRFSRLGRIDLHIDRVGMRQLVTNAVQAMKFQLDEAGATVEVKDLPDCLGDTTLIGQVFSNLLDNALKYRDPSRPCRVLIDGNEENGRTTYRVHDTGIGISAEHQPKVFELFHRLDPKRSQGEGLGLTIAQRALERLRGRIWVESTPGKGTTFHVSLPSVDSPRPRERKSIPALSS